MTKKLSNLLHSTNSIHWLFYSYGFVFSFLVSSLFLQLFYLNPYYSLLTYNSYGFLFFCFGSSSLFLQLFISNPSFLFCIFVLLFIIFVSSIVYLEPLFSVLYFCSFVYHLVSSIVHLGTPLFCSVFSLVFHHLYFFTCWSGTALFCSSFGCLSSLVLSLFKLSRNPYFDTMDWLGKG